MDAIIQLPVANIPAELPSSAVEIARYTSGVAQAAYLWNGTDPAVWPPEAVILGAWDEYTGLQFGQSFDADGVTVTGTPTYPINANYWTFIRPLGNVAGRATGVLDSIRFAGHSEPKFALDASRYPADDMPFGLQMMRVNQGADAPLWSATTTYSIGQFVQSPAGTTWKSLQDNNLNQTPFGGSPFWFFVNPAGWGWRVDVLAADPLRAITARAIAIYSDPACTAYLGTSGAFIDDGSGQFYCECPTALFTATKQPVHWALLWGSLQEGHYTMDGDQSDASFWDHDQGQAGSAMVVTNVGANAEMLLPQIYSPDGTQVVDIGSFNANRIFISLAGGHRDAEDPTIVLYLPTGIETIGFVWNNANHRYQSGPEIGLRVKILAANGQKIWASLVWS